MRVVTGRLVAGAFICLLTVERQFHGEKLLAGSATALETVRLGQLSQCLVKITLGLLVGQLCKLSAEVAICEFLHVPLVVAGYFLAFDALVEKVTKEFAHHAKARPNEIPVLLHKLRVEAG